MSRLKNMNNCDTKGCVIKSDGKGTNLRPLDVRPLLYEQEDMELKTTKIDCY